MGLIFVANRVDNGKQVKGFYWCIKEHYIEKLSGKHFIKSINNGVDYEIIFETLRPETRKKSVCVEFTKKEIEQILSYFAGDYEKNISWIFKVCLARDRLRQEEMEHSEDEKVS